MTSDDVLILLKIAVVKNYDWNLYELSLQTNYSQENIEESIFRLKELRLLTDNNQPDTKNLKRFLLEDLPELFPTKPGKLTRGMFTGFSAGAGFSFGVPRPSLWVWPKENGQDLGLEIEPLSPNCCFAALQDSKLRQVLSITDTLRIKGNDVRIWAEVLFRLNDLF